MGTESVITSEPLLASLTLSEMLERRRLALSRDLRWLVALKAHWICNEPSLKGHADTLCGLKVGSA